MIGGYFGHLVLDGYFGAATNAINGGLECRGDYKDRAKQRFEIYKRVLIAFNIPPNKAIENGCYN